MENRARLAPWVLAGASVAALLGVATYLHEAAPAAEVPTETFHVHVTSYEYSPGNLTVKAGTRVVLHLTAGDVPHGFAIEGHPVYETLQPGKEVVVTFVAGEAGVFDIYCTVFCGSGHAQHRGKLVVEA